MHSPNLGKACTPLTQLVEVPLRSISGVLQNVDILVQLVHFCRHADLVLLQTGPSQQCIRQSGVACMAN